MQYYRHCKIFTTFTGPRMDLGLILQTLNMITPRSFTGYINFLLVNLWGPVSFAVSASHMMWQRKM